MTKYLRFGYLMILFLALSGCAILKVQQSDTPRVEIAPGQIIQLPTPSQLNFNLTASQIVSAQYTIEGKTKTYTSEVQVEATPQQLLLVALSGWGGELFSLRYTGQTIQSSSLPMPNAAMGIKYTLSDFILTQASEPVLLSLLKPTEITVKCMPTQRIFTLHGKKIITIDYQGSDAWHGTVILHNFLFNYEVRVQTLSLTPAKM
jgi:hypothetical protein